MTKEAKNEAIIRQVKDNVNKLRQSDDPEVIKQIVCPFYQGGNHPECRRCRQPEEQLMECKDEYLLRIESQPLEKWNKDFDKITVRQKKPIKEIHDIGLGCNMCYMAKSCPQYEANATCSIDFTVDAYAGDPKKAVEYLIELQTERVNRASVIERMDGGIPDQNLSLEIDRLQSLIQTRSDLDMNKFSLRISGETNSAQQTTGAAGILSQIFGGGKKEELPPASSNAIVDIPFEEEKTIAPVPRKQNRT